MVRIPPSFAALLVVLAIATFVGVGLSVVFHRLILIPILVGAELAVGVVFVLVTFPKWYAELEAAARLQPTASPADTHPPTAPSEASAQPEPRPPPVPFDPVDEQPDYDPVEDADEHGAL